MSRRKNGTNRAATALGLSVYGPMNTKNRKRPKGAATPGAGLTRLINDRISKNGGKSNG